MKHILGPSLLIATIVLSSCAQPTSVKSDAIVAECQERVSPGGTYTYVEGSTVPMVTPVEDGTQAGADALNACIRDLAAAKGLVQDPITGRVGYLCQNGAPTIVGGATYCIGTN